MLPVEKARAIILSRMPLLPPEHVSLEKSLGRYLAEDIVSQFDIPSFPNSAMDGYAVRCADVAPLGAWMQIQSVLPAGTPPGQVLTAGYAIKIMTGAPVPEGADAVVRIEDTEEENNGVMIKKAPKRHENIRFKGEDCSKGQLILSKGDLLGPAQIGVLASLKRPMVQVHQRPVVAVLATGEEVVELGEGDQGHKIVSSNSYTLRALIKAAGGIALYLGIGKDSEADLISRLAGAAKADLILTSGGVSMGDYDLVRRVMALQGNTLEFWSVDMKPGKPLAFGSICSVPAIGLPGNPVSTMASFYQFARPAILKMQGARNLLLPRFLARLAMPVETKGDRRHYMRGIIKRSGDDLVVFPTGPQGSGILTSMSSGNCFIVVPEGTLQIKQGDYVECEAYQWP